MATNDIVLSAASRSNLLSLQSTQKLIDITQLRLATGKKVNSALDNPQSFFQSNALSNRAGDLTKLLDGIGQSIRTIEEADKGITALTSLVEQAGSVAEAAQAEIRAAEGLASITGSKDLRGINLTTQSNGTIAAAEDFQISLQHADINGGTVIKSAAIAITANDTVYDLVAKINKDATVTGTGKAFNTYVRASVDNQGHLKLESLFEGASLRLSDSGTAANSIDADGYAFLGLSDYVGTENNLAIGTTRQGGSVVAGRTLVSAVSGQTPLVDGKYEASAILNTAGAGASGFLTGAAADVDINFIIDGVTTQVALQLEETSTIQDFIDGVNNAGISDKVTASFNVDTGRVELKFADSVGTAEIQYDADGASTVAFGFGDAQTDGALAATQLKSERFRFVGSSADLDQYTKDYNKLRDQIDGIVADANYRGVNLLGGDNLTSFFNEDRSSSLITEGSDFTAVGLGLNEGDFADASGIQQALDEVSNALDAVRAFGSSIANDLAIIQARQVFTQETINTLKAGAADLVNADLNEEGANLLALQTAQQLGVTSLSLASQSQQSVLRLF